MSLSYALPFFCDAMLYYGALGCLGLLKACRADIFWVPVLLLAGCWLSGRLTGRGKPWLRWLPVAVIVPCLLVAGNAAGRLASLPMLAYLPMYVYNNRRAPDYYYAVERFRHSLIAAGFALLLPLLLRIQNWKGGLPYLFVYFTLNLALLRMLRHDDRVARSARFQLINLGGVALVCGVGFGLSQPGIVAALRVAWRWFLENVVLRLLAVILYLIQWGLYLGARMLSWLGVPSLDGVEIPATIPPAGSAAQAPLPGGDVQPLPPVVRFLIRAAGLALVVFVAFLVLRALSKRIARAQTHTGTDEREALDDADAPPPRRLRLRRDPEDGVRQQYRKALMLIRARGGRVAPTMNTQQIEEANADVVDPDALRALRALYLPARYGGRTPGREDVRKAREAVRRLGNRQ